MKTIIRTTLALIIAACALLAPRIMASDVDGGGPSWPTNPSEAAELFGVDNQRSAQADQWRSCEGEGTSCWNLKPGAATLIYVPFGAWVEGWMAPRMLGPIDGPWSDNVEGATVRRVQNPHRPLSAWPTSQDEAARAFGLRGQRSSHADQWASCAEELNCWILVGGEPTGVYSPVGSNLQGSRGSWNFGPADGPQAEFLDGATLRSRMLPQPQPGARKVYLPLVLKLQAPKGPITTWPSTKEEAATVFGGSGRSLDPNQWAPCPGEPACWSLKPGAETQLDIGAGAWIQGSNAAGTIAATLTPWTGKAEGASIRPSSTFPN